MESEQLFNLIGKLYVDLVNSQKIIEILQKKIQEKDQEILSLEGKK